MAKLSARARARKIRLLLFDVDGVLTDGKLYFLPESSGAEDSQADVLEAKTATPSPPRSAAGRIEVKGFHAQDGTAISLARIGGITTGLITKRISETVALRARDLRLTHVHQGIHDKRTCFEKIVKEAGIELEEAAFVGDDLMDLPAMRAAGLAIAVKNARPEVRREAHYITPHAGGDGALRDAVEYILKAQGKWKEVVESYIGDRSLGKGS